MHVVWRIRYLMTRYWRVTRRWRTSARRVCWTRAKTKLSGRSSSRATSTEHLARQEQLPLSTWLSLYTCCTFPLNCLLNSEMTQNVAIICQKRHINNNTSFGLTFVAYLLTYIRLCHQCGEVRRPDGWLLSHSLICHHCSLTALRFSYKDWPLLGSKHSSGRRHQVHYISFSKDKIRYD